MSDERHKAVTKAIARVIRTHDPIRTEDMPALLADAAIAALDAAEPTDVEIEAAINAWFSNHNAGVEAFRRRMRAALIAARNAGQE